MNTIDNFAESLLEPFRLEPDASLPNVAVVLDEFSTLCFADVANIWQIDPRRPDIDLHFVEFDFLLVESAWSGNSGRWRYMVTSNAGPRPPLVKLVEECRELGIPTIFWNKEDPPHFEEFIRTAEIFDFILTSDAATIPRYENRVPNAQVDLLRFAAAPSIHTPRWTSRYREGDIAFAGQYFSHKFPERRQQMEVLFPVAAKFDFSIFSRALGRDSRYQFPEPFDRHVAGSLPYGEMVEEYRRHKVFLNVNSVVDSATMCARRVFELSASKTAVVGMESEAVRSVYTEDEVPLVSNADQAREVFERLTNDDIFRRQTVQKAWRKTLSSHTYAHRIEQIQQLIGNKAQNEPLHVHIFIAGGDTTEGMANLLASIRNQRFSFDRVVDYTLELLDGSAEMHDLLDEESRTIPGCGIATNSVVASNSYIAFMDSRFRYGEFYLNDLVLTVVQQSSNFAAKVLAKNISEVKGIEERKMSFLPAYGWLMKPGDPQTGIRLARVLSRGQDRMFDSTIDCYFSDPFEIAAAEGAFVGHPSLNEEHNK